MTARASPAAAPRARRRCSGSSATSPRTPRKNVIAMWHHPRFSSGATELLEFSRSSMRCTPRTPTSSSLVTTTSTSGSRLLGPNGTADPNGMRYFTAGTGGESHHSIGTSSRKRGSQCHDVRRAASLYPAPDELRLGLLPGRGLQLHRLRQPVDRRANSAPLATVVLTPGSADTNYVLTATATKSDADGDAVQPHLGVAVNGRQSGRSRARPR